MASAAGVARYLLSSYGNDRAYPAVCAVVTPVVSLRLQQQGGDVADDDKPRLEGAAALEIFYALRTNGAQPPQDFLNTAAKAGHVEVVRELLGMGVQGWQLRGALLLALEHGKHLERTVELVRLLEGAGTVASVDIQCSALMRNRDFRLASRLLDALGLSGAAGKERLLRVALETGNRDLALEFLDAGAEPHPHALLAACVEEDDALCERLLRAGADPHLALLAAARADRPGRLRQLLEAAALPAGHYHLGQALQAAYAGGSVSCVEELGRAGVDPIAPFLLEPAVAGGHVALVRLLLDSGRYNASSHELSYALGLACSDGLTEVVERLLGEGAEPAPEAMVMASAAGHADVVRLLLTRAPGAFPRGVIQQAMEEARCVAAIQALDPTAGLDCDAATDAVREGDPELVLLLLAEAEAVAAP